MFDERTGGGGDGGDGGGDDGSGGGGGGCGGGKQTFAVGSDAYNSFTRSAYRSVFSECSHEPSPGLMVAI